ncbi:MAG: tyrosine-type recombinase/integrase [Gammaproteobacteria bacterium]|nr:tyrosine-type recombinase/integrase [Gammaproteobacteria bacterium]
MPGLRWRNGVWHIEKRCKEATGGWLRESTGQTERAAAERFLIRRLAEIAESAKRRHDGRHTFEEAGLKYLEDIAHKPSADTAAMHLDQLFPWVGALDLESIHDGTLAPFVAHELSRRVRGRERPGISPKGVNNALGVVSAVLNRAARVWRDEEGRPWLRQAPPQISRLPLKGKQSKPYPLSWIEQDRLIAALPGHLQAMALYAVNTGCREQEVCQLRWSWLHGVDGVQVVVIPEGFAKNEDERVVVLNSIARSIVDAQKGRHPEFVFSYARGRKDPKILPVGKMNSTAWRRAWKAAGLPVVGWTHGVHNLRHTFGRRLRAAGVALETRKALLGHRDGDLTTHYSAAEIRELLEASERVTRRSTEAPTLRIVGQLSDRCRMEKKKAGAA